MGFCDGYHYHLSKSSKYLSISLSLYMPWYIEKLNVIKTDKKCLIQTAVVAHEEKSEII